MADAGDPVVSTPAELSDNLSQLTARVAALEEKTNQLQQTVQNLSQLAASGTEQAPKTQKTEIVP